MTRTSRLLRRLVVVGASTAVIGAGVIPLAEGVANAAAGDNATSVTLAPHSASDTINDCTPYVATVAPATATFDLEISETVPSGKTANIGFCDMSADGFSTTTYPNQQNAAAPVPSNADTTVAGSNCAATSPAAPAAQVTDACDVQFTAVNGKVSFALYSDTPGSESIVAYNDIHSQNSVFEPGLDQTLDQTSETWVDNIASNVSCTPSSQTAQAGSTVHFTCTATTSAGTSFNDAGNSLSGAAALRDVVTAGGDVSEENDCTYTYGNTVGSTNGQNGTWDCPVTNATGATTDTVKAYGDNNGDNVQQGTEPVSAAVTATFVAPAPAGATLTLTCSPNSSTTNPDTCILPLNTNAATITATVKSSAGAPVAGALVSFSMGNTGGNRVGINPDGDETLGTTSCTTGADGTCTDTLTDASPNDPEGVRVTGSVPLAVAGPATDTSDVIWQQPRAYEARFIAVTPDRASQAPGAGQAFVAKVTNRSGDPVGGVCVGWSLAGVGQFANPNQTNCGKVAEGSPTTTAADFSFGTTCFTGADGTCAVQLNTFTNQSGTSTVTGTLLTSSSGPGAHSGNNFTYEDVNGVNRTAFECSLAAGTTFGAETLNRTGYTSLPDQSTTTGPPTADEWSQTGLAAGTCSDNGGVTWKAPTVTQHRVVVNLHLSCFSPKRHVVKCVGQLSRPISGVTVVFRNAKGHVVGRDVTNRAGKAVMKLRGLKSHRTHRYHAHAKKSAKTFGADSNTAKVRVS